MDNSLIKYLLTLAVLFSSLTLFAQSEMTLEAATKYAKENSLSIKNAQIKIADAEAQIEERKSVGLPQLNGKIDYSFYFKVPTVQLPGPFVDLARDPMTGQLPDGYSPNVSFSLKHNFNLGLSLDALIFDGSYFTALKAARNFRNYVDYELKAKEKELADKVREAYLPSLLITESIGNLDKNLTNLQKLFTETQAMYKEGFIEQLDVDRLELSIANLTTEKQNLIRQRESAMNFLKFSINYPIDKELVLTDNVQTLLTEATEEDLTGEVNVQSHSQYQVIEKGLELNAQQVEIYRKGYLPSLAAFASYQYGFQGNQLNSTGFWVPVGLVGAQINVPIFDGFDKRAKIQRAKLAQEIAYNQKREFERAITLELQNARTAYTSARNQVASQKKNMELAEKIYNTTRVKYREGVGSSLEISQAEQSLYTTQQNHLVALYDLLVAKAALDKALGN